MITKFMKAPSQVEKALQEIQDHKIYKFLSGFATLTGSCALGDVFPNDIDFFSKLEYEPLVREKLINLGATPLDSGSSLEESWGRQRRYKLNINEYKVELFFVEPKYHAVLTLVSQLTTNLCDDRLFKAVLKDKEARIRLYESARDAILKREPRTVSFEIPGDDSFDAIFMNTQAPKARKIDL